jgi:hypothetical protein
MSESTNAGRTLYRTQLLIAYSIEDPGASNSIWRYRWKKMEDSWKIQERWRRPRRSFQTLLPL